MKKWYILSGSVLLILLLLWVFRFALLRSIGYFLIAEDPLAKASVMFVLGGNGYDRGLEAARLYRDGYAGSIICTSENIPSNIKILHMDQPESEMTRIRIIREGVPESAVTAVHTGTSTMEEVLFYRDYCRKHRIDRAIILSSKFHTRRVRYVINKLWENEKTKLIIRGAPSLKYLEDKWWESEQGLLMVNNEYVKLIYYWWRY